MASALLSVSNCCLEYREPYIPQVELEQTSKFVGEGGIQLQSDTRGKKYEKPKQELISTKAEKLESIISNVKIESGRSLTTEAVYMKYDELPPVYAENGSIVVESERLEAREQYRVIIDNVRYTIFKNEKGEIAIGVSPPHD